MEMLVTRRHSKAYAPARASLPTADPITVFTVKVSRAESLGALAQLFGLDPEACEAQAAEAAAARARARTARAARPAEATEANEAKGQATAGQPSPRWAPVNPPAMSEFDSEVAPAAETSPMSPTPFVAAAAVPDPAEPISIPEPAVAQPGLCSAAALVSEEEQADLRCLCTLAECEDSKLQATAMTVVNRCRLAVASALFAHGRREAGALTGQGLVQGHDRGGGSWRLQVKQEAFPSEYSHRNRVLVGAMVRCDSGPSVAPAVAPLC